MAKGWFDGLGYTWISDDQWGWLPYHYGRWTRLDNLGWVWVPSKIGIFKPGDVYWVRSSGSWGWGPLAPGEQWDPADLVNPLPQQFLDVNTTYAAARANAAVIDPAGFTARPKDPLKTAGVPERRCRRRHSSRRTGAVRPLVNAATLRVKPVVDGVTVDTAPRVTERPQLMPPPPAPVVIVTQAAPQPRSEPEVIVAPVPVPAGIVFLNDAASLRREASHEDGGAGAGDRADAAPRKTRSNGGEEIPECGGVGAGELNPAGLGCEDFQQSVGRSRGVVRALPRDGIFRRAGLLLHAGIQRIEPAREGGGHRRAAAAKPVTETFEDPMQALSVLYVTVTNFQKLTRPTRDQSATARTAARELLELLPTCFTAERRPAVMTAADWASRAPIWKYWLAKSWRVRDVSLLPKSPFISH